MTNKRVLIDLVHSIAAFHARRAAFDPSLFKTDYWLYFARCAAYEIADIYAERCDRTWTSRFMEIARGSVYLKGNLLIYCH